MYLLASKMNFMSNTNFIADSSYAFCAKIKTHVIVLWDGGMRANPFIPGIVILNSLLT